MFCFGTVMKDRLSRSEIPYFQVGNALVDGDELEGVYEKMCYVVMARYTNNGGVGFPSYNTIARGMGVSRNSAIKAVKGLEAKGILVVENKFVDGVQKANHYTLGLLGGVHEVDWGSAGDALGVVHEVDTDKEQLEKEKEKKKGMVDLLEGVPERILPLAEKWVAYKREIKDPVKTKHGMAKFRKHSYEALAWAVDESMSNEWKGLFPDKYKPIGGSVVSQPRVGNKNCI